MKHVNQKPIQTLVVACFDEGLSHKTAINLAEAMLNKSPNEVHAALTEAITEIYDVESDYNYGGPLADFCRNVRYALIEIQKTVMP